MGLKAAIGHEVKAMKYRSIRHLSLHPLLWAACLTLLLSTPWGSADAFGAVGSGLEPGKEKGIKASLDTLPVPFIENQPRVEGDPVRFFARMFAGTVLVEDTGIRYLFPRKREEAKGKRASSPAVIKESFVGARTSKPEGLRASRTRVSYFGGSDRSQWKSGLPTFESVGYGDIYRDISLSLHAYGKTFEKIFTVKPGGNPRDIAGRLEGARSLRVNRAGELEVKTAAGAMKITAPAAYHEYPE